MLIIIFSVFNFCFMLERIFTGWEFPELATWTIRVIAINFVQLAIATLAGYTWKNDYQQQAYSLSNHDHSV